MAAQSLASHVDAEIQQQRTEGDDLTHDATINRGELAQSGKCGFRELNTGVECGCQHFWTQPVTGVSQCACGHHACFHAPATIHTVTSIQESVETRRSSNVNEALLQHLAHISSLLSGLASSGDALGAVRALGSAPGPNTPGQLETIPDTDPLPQLEAAAVVEREQAGELDALRRSTPSKASTSYLPRLPSGCALPEDDSAMQNGHEHVSTSAGQALLPTNHAAGLGLWLSEVAAASKLGDVQSVSGPQILSQSTGEVVRAFRMFEVPDSGSESNMPRTREASGRILAPGQKSQQSLLPAIDVANFASLRGFDELLQSATEAATPTVGTRTPDLNIPPAIIRQTIETGLQAVARPSPQRMPPPSLPRSANGTPAIPTARPLLSVSSQALSPPFLARDAQNIHDISIHLHAVRKFVTGQGSQLRGLGDRLEAVERMSFSQTPRDLEIIEKLELIETKIIEVEGKVDDARGHGLLNSSRSDHGALAQRRHTQLREAQSVASNQSFHSTNSATSSTALLRGDADTIKKQIDNLDGRVTDIEKSLPPSFSRPLEVEVVLIPWGRELRGLWVTTGEKSNQRQNSQFRTQDTEDWTSSRGLRSSSRVSASLRSTADSGWTSEAIHDWADDADAWLVPRACGIKSVTYHRLKSRGFVKTIEVTKLGAKEIYQKIKETFNQTLVMLNAPSLPSEEETEDGAGKTLLGLNAAIIPLRKVHRSSQLQFLTKSEMLTPALWTGEFLMSSTMMHGSGGLKRLFITHREAYLQRPDAEYAGWNWQRIRQLPRAGSESGHVVEGDARETCWADHPVLDAPPLSVSTSFASHASSSSHQTRGSQQRQSGEKHDVNAMDDKMADIKSESHSGFESEAVAAARKPFVPITPVTETDNFSTQDAYRLAHMQSLFDQPWDDMVSGDDAGHASTPHPTNQQSSYYDFLAVQPRYNLRKHTRSLSNPFADAADGDATRSMRPSQPGRRATSSSFKRIARSFSTPSNPLIASLPTFVPVSPNNSRPRSRRRVTGDGSAVHKRRRVDRSVSAEAYLQYANSRRSRSASLIPYGQPTSSGKKGKRATTPIGPYMTPYSGNFGSGFGTNPSVRSPVGGDSDEWEGVGDDDHEQGQDHPTTLDSMKLNTVDLMMDEEEEEEEDDDEEDNDYEGGEDGMNHVGFE